MRNNSTYQNSPDFQSFDSEIQSDENWPAIHEVPIGGDLFTVLEADGMALSGINNRGNGEVRAIVAMGLRAGPLKSGLFLYMTADELRGLATALNGLADDLAAGLPGLEEGTVQ